MEDRSEIVRLTSDVKAAALDSGMDLVGIVSAQVIDSSPRVWVGWKINKYAKRSTEILSGAESVVVMAYHIWDDMLELAITKGGKWVYPEYFSLKVSEAAVISKMEKEGYRGVPARGLPYKRLAQLAGFGNYGKNALIVSPEFGPWLRFAAVLTDAKLVPDKPFEDDVCGNCTECIQACPVGALTPYKVDDQKCLVGIHITGKERFERNQEYAKYEPSLTQNAHLMCMRCQKACPLGRASAQNVKSKRLQPIC